MKNVVAYCRVSTDKEDQLNSFEAQKAFFSEYMPKVTKLLPTIIGKMRNKEDFVKILLFDHIIFNTDKLAAVKKAAKVFEESLKLHFSEDEYYFMANML